MAEWTVIIWSGNPDDTLPDPVTPQSLGIIVGSMVNSRQSQGVDELTFSTVGDYDGTQIIPYGYSLILLRDGVRFFQGTCTTTPRTADAVSEGIDYVIAGPWWELERTTFMQSYSVVKLPEEFTKSQVLVDIVIDAITGDAVEIYETVDTPVLEEKFTPRVIMFPNSEFIAPPIGVGGDPIPPEDITAFNNQVSTSDALTEIIEYAQSCGILISLGTLPTEKPIPWTAQFQDLTIAQVIQTVLRWHPDVIIWWDYSDITPQINFVSRSSAKSFTHNLIGDTTGVNVIPRNDLKPSLVALHYQTTKVTDGVPYKTYDTDIYPPLAEPGPADGPFSKNALGVKFPNSVNISIDLRGTNVTRQYQSLRTKKIPTSSEPKSFAQRVFWRRHLPRLAKDPFNDAESFTVENFSRELASGAGEDDPEEPLTRGARVLKQSSEVDDYPRELLDGSIDDWMSVRAAPVVVSARIYCSSAVYGSLDTEDKNFFPNTDGGRRYAVVSATIMGTNGRTKNYSRISSFTEGESVPLGLAKHFYQSLETLQYEGSVQWTGDEVEASNLMGKTLNLENGRPEWATMNAVIQQVSYSFADGVTNVSFGPAEQLSPQDLVEQLRLSKSVTYTYENTADNDDQSEQYNMGSYAQPIKDTQWATGGGGDGSTFHPWVVEIYTGNRSEGDDEQVLKARWKIGGRVYDSPLMETAAASESDNAVIVEEILNTYGVYALLDQDGIVTIAVISSVDELYPKPVGWDDLTLNRGGPYNLGTEEEPEWGFAKRIVLFGDIASINDVTSNLAVVSACYSGEVRPTIISI